MKFFDRHMVLPGRSETVMLYFVLRYVCSARSLESLKIKWNVILVILTLSKIVERTKFLSKSRKPK